METIYGPCNLCGYSGAAEDMNGHDCGSVGRCGLNSDAREICGAAISREGCGLGKKATHCLALRGGQDNDFAH